MQDTAAWRQPAWRWGFRSRDLSELHPVIRLGHALGRRKSESPTERDEGCLQHNTSSMVVLKDGSPSKHGWCWDYIQLWNYPRMITPHCKTALYVKEGVLLRSQPDFVRS
jgi:hypothetical protein